MNRLVNGAAHFKRLKLSVWDVMVPFVVLLSLNVVFLLIWSLVSRDDVGFQSVA